MNKSRPTQNKRARERARQERQQQKAERRAEAKQRKTQHPSGGAGEDPDIAGIVPGPQRNPWAEMLGETGDQAEDEQDEAVDK